LRQELVQRFAAYAARNQPGSHKKHGVYPV